VGVSLLGKPPPNRKKKKDAVTEKFAMRNLETMEDVNVDGMHKGRLGRAMNTLYVPPAALLAFTKDHPASPGLLAKATAAGIGPCCAELACSVLTRAIECLDTAGQMRRGGFARAKLIETALQACRPPVSDALRVAMVACPVDGRALLRLWAEVADYHERGAMLDMLRG
jgi:hypothetical protein